TYSATVNVYGNKDGKPDLDNIVATKKVTIKINVKETSDTANGSLSPSNSGSGVTQTSMASIGFLGLALAGLLGGLGLKNKKEEN
ncbi:TPA: fibronectin-binding SSURE repeat-containing protein, partial [Streptococcus pneumoniae]